jgi:RNA polymerase sigma-70 factor (ECF subfamily)
MTRPKPAATSLAPVVPAGELSPPAPNGPGELSDEAVARRVLAGERELFELLMRRYNRRLYRVARAVVMNDAEAEDVLQEAWLSAFEHLGQFDGRARLATWLAKIALHAALARRRRAGRFQPLAALDDDTRPEELLPDAGADPERRAASSELGQLLAEELAQLSETTRAVFVLRSVEELSTAETAAALGLAEGAVKVRLHRARERLRGALDRRFDRAARELWGFLGERCDRTVAIVLGEIGARRA